MESVGNFNIKIECQQYESLYCKRKTILIVVFLSILVTLIVILMGFILSESHPTLNITEHKTDQNRATICYDFLSYGEIIMRILEKIDNVAMRSTVPVQEFPLENKIILSWTVFWFFLYNTNSHADNDSMAEHDTAASPLEKAQSCVKPLIRSFYRTAPHMSIFETTRVIGLYFLYPIMIRSHLKLHLWTTTQDIQ